MNYIRKIPKVILRVRKNPKLLKYICTYVKNDICAFVGKYNYDYSVIFVAGLPKSGTTWVETQLQFVPGFNLRSVNDPDKCTFDHDICESVFLSLPKYGYSILKLHTKYSKRNFEIIRKYVPKFLVIIRDLRDMCVSRYFHIKNEKEHRHHELYNKESLSDSMMHAISVVEEEYVSWVRDWFNVINDYPEMILFITYEELSRSPAGVFKKILEFYNLPIDENLIRMFAESKLKQEKKLYEELSHSVGLVTRSTKRKGIVGDWKNYFDVSHKKRFKEIAGDLLIELGYEKDFNW